MLSLSCTPYLFNLRVLRVYNMCDFKYEQIKKLAHAAFFLGQSSTSIICREFIFAICKVNLYELKKNQFFYFRSRRYSGENRGGWACGNWFEFLLVVVVSSILLLAAMGLVIFWVFYYRGGVGWQDEPQLHFNLHPILMVTGFVTLSGFCESSAKKYRSKDFYFYTKYFKCLQLFCCTAFVGAVAGST